MYFLYEYIRLPSNSGNARYKKGYLFYFMSNALNAISFKQTRPRRSEIIDNAPSRTLQCLNELSLNKKLYEKETINKVTRTPFVIIEQGLANLQQIDIRKLLNNNVRIHQKWMDQIQKNNKKGGTRYCNG